MNFLVFVLPVFFYLGVIVMVSSKNGAKELMLVNQPVRDIIAIENI